MSKELEELLSPPNSIPWDSASSFFVAIKDATKIAQANKGTVANFISNKAKKAEMTKYTGSRHSNQKLTKIAQGELSTEPEEDFGSTTSGITPDQRSQRIPSNKTQKSKNGKLVPADQSKNQGVRGLLAQEQKADEIGKINETEYYRQIADEAGAQAEQLESMLQEAQAVLQQTFEQAQMSQMQADQAVQQSTMQAQQDAMEKQQLSEEGLQARQNLMQLRQAMMAYRENLQQLALQDPTAMFGGLPEEQGMLPPEMASQGAVPPGMEGANPEDLVALEQEAAQEAAQEMKQPKKESVKENKKSDDNKSNVTVNVEKKGSILPKFRFSSFYKKASAKERAIGAAIGAPLFAGIQSISDIRNKGGESAKETALRLKLQELQGRKESGPLHQHKINLTEFLYNTAKINREHPQSAAMMAALTGAGLGATIGPDVGKRFKSVFTQIAQRGGK